MKKPYRVCVQDPPRVYNPSYFPRRFAILREAKAAAQTAVDDGASHACIELPNGARLDFRPPRTELARITKRGNAIIAAGKRNRGMR